MAFMISDTGVITMFRGDDVNMPVELHLADIDGTLSDEIYAMQPGDTLTFTVRRKPSEQSPVLLSVVSTGPYIQLRPQDTSGLEVGKYSADIQLNHGGLISTVFPALDNLSDAQRSRIRAWDNFIVIGEVTI